MEQHRLNMLQLVYRTLCNGNLLPPVSPKMVLDIGTGGGAWCIEVAKEFPDAIVHGIDISPITRIDVPKNCLFTIGDFNEGLNFNNDTMDVIHLRFIQFHMSLT